MLFHNQNVKSRQGLPGLRQIFRYQHFGRAEIFERAAKNRTLWAAACQLWTAVRQLWKAVRQKTRHIAVICLAIILFNMFGAAEISAAKLVFPKYKGIIVLDPGHGGNDPGAQNSEGIQEKAVTLNLARMIADRISDDYKVVLTRTDDYWVDIPDRTAVANNQKADLFISLHAGGAFLHSVGGTSVFYYDSYSDSTIREKKPALDPLQDPDAPIPWNRIQDRHLTRSKKFAGIVQSALFRITQNSDNSIRGAPLVVLKGADMPAVLIELGYLTHPNESKALVDENFLILITDAIIKAIEDFLSKKAQ